jgi:hypothetical protein
VLGLGLAVVVATGGAARAEAGCPWIVQPAATSVTAAAATPPAYDIVFEGLERETRFFYGFTVASLDLAWQLANGEPQPELEVGARPLATKADDRGAPAFHVAGDTIEPHTIYLVAAGNQVAVLDQIGARIEPPRAIAVSQYRPRTRGGTDWSGAMPRRSLPGYELASPADTAARDDTANRHDTKVAAMQICAYQVAVR